MISKIPSGSSAGGKPIDQIDLAAVYQLAHTPNLASVFKKSEFVNAVQQVFDAVNTMTDREKPATKYNSLEAFLKAIVDGPVLTELAKAQTSEYYSGTRQVNLGTTFVLPISSVSYRPEMHGKVIGQGYIDGEPNGYARAPFLRYSTDPRSRSEKDLAGSLIGRRCIFRSYKNGQTYEVHGTIFSPFAHSWDDGVVIQTDDGKFVSIKGPLASSRPDLHLENRGDLIPENPR